MTVGLGVMVEITIGLARVDVDVAPMYLVKLSLIMVVDPPHKAASSLTTSV